ncbi:MAG: hypothetical protein QXL86_01350 [Candidatus Aenigmatarchaeota archaeon]
MIALKSQSSFEFIVYFILLLAISLVVFAINVQYQIVIRERKFQMNAQRILESLENEISIAIKMGDGYEKTFVFLPSTENLESYRISSLGGGIIKVEWDGNYLYGRMPTRNLTDGTSDKFSIFFGENKISNQKGNIIIQKV